MAKIRGPYQRVIDPAAEALVALIRKSALTGQDPLVYARPSTLTRKGWLIVTTEKMPPPHTLVRPKGGRSWRSVPFSSVWDELWAAARNEPIL